MVWEGRSCEAHPYPNPSGGANTVAGCWPTPEEYIPSGLDRVRVGLITTTIFLSTNLPVLKGVIEADVVRQGRVYSEGP